LGGRPFGADCLPRKPCVIDFNQLPGSHFAVPRRGTTLDEFVADCRTAVSGHAAAG